MTTKKETVGQKFIKLLNEVEGSKEGLLKLAAAVIKNSHTKLGLKNRNLPDTAEAINMMAVPAKINALAGRDVSTDKMLALVMHTYKEKKFGSPEKFKEDFKKRYPEEYDKPKEVRSYTNPTIQKAAYLTA